MCEALSMMCLKQHGVSFQRLIDWCLLLRCTYAHRDRRWLFDICDIKLLEPWENSKRITSIGVTEERNKTSTRFMLTNISFGKRHQVKLILLEKHWSNRRQTLTLYVIFAKSLIINTIKATYNRSMRCLTAPCSAPMLTRTPPHLLSLTNFMDDPI